jgi:hypothetical protein
MGIFMNQLQKFIEQNKNSIIAEPSGLTLSDLRKKIVNEKIFIINGKI